MIPFELTGDSKTVVLEDKFFTMNGKAILILPVDDEQFKDPDACNATYDLRIGGHYRDHTDSAIRALATEDFISMPSGAAVVIETIEYVRFPKWIFGYITPKVSLLHQGVSNTSSKVDPGYYGHLYITVFNLGRREVKLKWGTPFCGLSLHLMQGNPKPYRGPAKGL